MSPLPPNACRRLRNLCLSKVNPWPPEVDEALARPGSDQGAFVLVRLLGSGGMGEVWKAWRKDLGRYEALKYVRADASGGVLRLREEAHLMSRLDHPNIAQVYGVETDSRGTFLRMQYIPGTTIDRAGLDLRTTLGFLRDVALALDFAHRRGVVHRDVKPSNLMVADGRVTLVDFGVARPLKADVTQTRPMEGTPAFMSPELLSGERRSADAVTEVYSLGATLSILAPAPRPRDVETIVLKATEPDRARRYAGVLEFAEDVRRFLEGRPVLARRPSRAYRAGKWLSRHRWLSVALGGALAVTVAFGLYLLSIRLRRSAALREGEEAERVGQWERALGAYQRASALDPYDRSIRRRAVHAERQILARDARQRAELTFQEVERELRELRLRTYQPDLRISEQDLERYQARVETCLRQMGETGDSAAGWWVVGRWRHLHGDARGAEEAYRNGLRVAPDHSGCLLHLAQLHVDRAMRLQCNADREDVLPVAQQILQEASALLERGIASGGIDSIELDLARGYRRVVAGQDCREFCDRMLEKWEHRAYRENFYLIRGLADPDRLVEDATKALRICPSSFETLVLRGEARMRVDDLQGAEVDFSKAIEIHPRYSSAYVCRAIARTERKDLDGAMRDFGRALELQPRSVGAYANRGAAHFRFGNPAAAVADLTKAIEIEPGDPAGYLKRGSARDAAGDFAGAIEDCTRAVELSPCYARAFAQRASSRSSGGDFVGAIEDFTRAIEIQPNIPRLYAYRARCSIAAGRASEAVGDYRKALELAPPDWAMREECLRELKSVQKGSR